MLLVRPGQSLPPNLAFSVLGLLVERAERDAVLASRAYGCGAHRVGCEGQQVDQVGAVRGLLVASGEQEQVVDEEIHPLSVLGDVFVGLSALGCGAVGVAQGRLGEALTGLLGCTSTSSSAPRRRRRPQRADEFIRLIRLGFVDAEFEQQMLIKKRETVAEFREGVVGVSGCEEG